MKSLKKTLVLLVVFSMILSAVMPAFAAIDVAGLDCEEEVARLEALGVVTGVDNEGHYAPEQTVTRAQMAVILCKMVGIDEVTVAESANVPSKFSDVAAGAWYTGYINVAAGKGLLSGFPDGTFRPDEQLTMNHVLTLCVNALGRGEYVAQMGTWPANYIAEATKLGLVDGVSANGGANRGNVAIIVWNTLEAPYVWDVTSTEYEGSINLSDGGKRTLLSIYFRDFATEAGELKEVTVDPTETTVAFDDRFIELEDDVFADFADTDELADMFDFRTKTSDDKTHYIENEGTVYVYVPEDVMEDVEDLKNREFTLLLGKDNTVVAVFVEDDVVESAFLTDFDGVNKIKVGGEEYKLADPYKVVVNGVPTTYDDNLTGALNAILVVDNDFEDIEKRIEATLTRNSKGKVETIELFTSANTLDNTVEVLVEEVKEGKNKFTLYLSDSEAIVVEDDYEELPKVYVDGAKAELSDIEAGNVLTIITNADSDSEVKYDTAPIAKIYVSTETVVGEPNRVRKSNNAIEIDGTEYTHSEGATTASIIYVEELEKDAETAAAFSADTIMDNEQVTLYLNIFGECVAAYVEDGSNSDYQFGIVTRYYATLGSEGEDDEIDTRNIKILTKDGANAKKYTLKLDTSDESIDNVTALEDLVAGDVENKLVMFVADADGNIDWEEFFVIDDIDDANDEEALEDYTFIEADAVEGKKVIDKAATSNKYRYSSSKTVMFNIGGTGAGLCEAEDDDSHVDGCSKAEHADVPTEGDPCDGTYDIDAKVMTDWSAILDADDATDLAATAICVLDKDENLVCISLLVTGDGSSDTEYAVVSEEIYIGKDMDTAILLLDGKETELDAKKGEVTDFVTGAFISYKAPSNKIKTADLLVDVAAFNKLLTETDKALDTNILPTATIVDGSGDYAWAENFEVEAIYFDENADEDEYEIEYVEIKSPEADQTAELEGFYITEDDTTVYDLRNDACNEITMKALMAEVENGAEVYVVKVVSETDEVVLVVLGETAE